MRHYLTIRDKVEELLKYITDQKFKKNIEDDVDLFVKAFQGKSIKTIKLFFLVFLEYLGRKHNSSIVTRAYVLKNFGIKRYGWMKRQNKMIKMGIVEEINKPRDYMIPARRIITEMKEVAIISDKHHKKIIKIFYNIPTDFPMAMRGKNKEIIIAFLAICSTKTYETLDDIVILFRQLEIHRGLVIEKGWGETLQGIFYRSIQRQKKSGGFVPEFGVTIDRHISVAREILKDLNYFKLISHEMFVSCLEMVESVPHDYPRVLESRDKGDNIALIAIYSSTFEPHLFTIAKMFQHLQLEKGLIKVETFDHAKLMYLRYFQMIKRVIVIGEKKLDTIKDDPG